MTIAIVPVVFFSFTVCLFLAFYVFGTFTSEIGHGCLILNRKIFRVIPFGRRSVQLSYITEVRRFDLRRDWFRGAEVFGNLFWRPGVLIILKKGFCRRIYLTPSEPDSFIKLLQMGAEVHVSTIDN